MWQIVFQGKIFLNEHLILFSNNFWKAFWLEFEYFKQNSPLWASPKVERSWVQNSSSLKNFLNRWDNVASSLYGIVCFQIPQAQWKSNQFYLKYMEPRTWHAEEKKKTILLWPQICSCVQLMNIVLICSLILSQEFHPKIY